MFNAYNDSYNMSCLSLVLTQRFLQGFLTIKPSSNMGGEGAYLMLAPPTKD